MLIMFVYIRASQSCLYRPLDLIWLYIISTIVGYLMSNPLFTYLLNIGFVDLFGFYSISTLVGARGVVVIVVGNGHGDSCSNPGRD